MKKCIAYIIMLCMCISFTKKKEKTSIKFEKEIIVFNSDTLFLNRNIRGLHIKKLETYLKEKSHKIVEDKSTVFYYYFKKSGIVCTANSLSAPEYPANFDIIFKKNQDMRGQLKTFNGEVKLFGVSINKNTTFNELLNHPQLIRLIDYSYYAKDTNTAIIINTEFNSYSIRFCTRNKNALIESISANF